MDSFTEYTSQISPSSHFDRMCFRHFIWLYRIEVLLLPTNHRPWCRVPTCILWWWHDIHDAASRCAV